MRGRRSLGNITACVCVCERERERESVSVLEHSSMDMERHFKLVSQGNICF